MGPISRQTPRCIRHQVDAAPVRRAPRASNPVRSLSAEASDETLFRLGTYAYANAPLRRRSPERDFFVAYKNQRGHRAITLELLNPDLGKPAALARRLPSFEELRLPTDGASPRGIKEEATEYETAVLSLRTGDRITDGSEPVTLGSFLGAGNISHVFEDANRPGTIVKIPFASGPLLYIEDPVQYREFEKRHPIDYPRGFIDILRDLRPLFAREEVLQPVELEAVGLGSSWARLERVAVEESGDEFLLRIAGRASNGSHPEDSLSPAEQTQLEQLRSCFFALQRVERTRAIEKMCDEAKRRLVLEIPRLFSFLTSEPDWYRLRSNPWQFQPNDILAILLRSNRLANREQITRTFHDLLQRVSPARQLRFEEAVRQLAWTGERWRLLDWE